MRLTTLLAAVESETSATAPVGAGASDPEVHRVVHDSRKTAPGDLFCCVPGLVHDGHTHAGLAVEAGAVGWTLPVVAGLFAAPLLAAITARKDLGRRAEESGLFQVADPWWRTQSYRPLRFRWPTGERRRAIAANDE